jgi:dsRNA-specific ribonuclease
MSDSNASDGEQTIFDPYNPNNTEITLNDVQCILKTYGLPPTVHNLNLYKRAFIHTSYVKRPHKENEENNVLIAPKPMGCMELKTKSNERLEFLGDGILEAITKFYLYKRFPKENEGFMTEKKIALVKNESIGRFSLNLRLQRWFIISRHAEDKNIRTNIKKLGCLFEAFLGALFLDFNKLQVDDTDNYFANLFVTGPGFQMAQLFVESVFEKHVDWIELLKSDDNYKNILQVLIQKRFKTTPDYLIIDESNDEEYGVGVFLCLNCKVYNMDYRTATPLSHFADLEAISATLTANPNAPVFVLMGTGSNKTKKKAEQAACKMALDYLNYQNE